VKIPRRLTGWRRTFALRAEQHHAGFNPRRKGTGSSVPQPTTPSPLFPLPWGEGVHVYEPTVNSDGELTVATNFSPSGAP